MKHFVITTTTATTRNTLPAKFKIPYGNSQIQI